MIQPLLTESFIKVCSTEQSKRPSQAVSVNKTGGRRTACRPVVAWKGQRHTHQQAEQHVDGQHADAARPAPSPVRVDGKDHQRNVQHIVKQSHGGCSKRSRGDGKRRAG